MDVPVVDETTEFKRVLEMSEGYDMKLIPALIDERKTLRHVLDATHAQRILLLIGPEGDFTPEELHEAKQKGFVPITLGKNVLRVETAAVCAAAFIRFYENS